VGCDPAIGTDGDLPSVVALQADWDIDVLESVVDGPNCATWADQRVISDFNSTGGIQLRIGTNADIATERQLFRKINYHAPKHTASGLSVISI